MMNIYDGEICGTCLNGVPSVKRNSCIPFPKENPIIFQNCLYGFRFVYTNTPYCTGCKSGYMLYKNRKLKPALSMCMKETEDKIGCSRTISMYDDGKLYCQSCDETRGYHFSGNRRQCVKN